MNVSSRELYLGWYFVFFRWSNLKKLTNWRRVEEAYKLIEDDVRSWNNEIPEGNEKKHRTMNEAFLIIRNSKAQTFIVNSLFCESGEKVYNRQYNAKKRYNVKWWEVENEVIVWRIETGKGTTADCLKYLLYGWRLNISRVWVECRGASKAQRFCNLC